VKSRELYPAFVLHAKPYRDTSLIVDFFTKDYGCVSAVARGARSHRSKLRGLIQPFVPLLINCFGKSELQTLRTVEPSGVMHYLTSHALISGLYLNELLIRLLHRSDPHPELFDAYEQALGRLQAEDSIEKSLREFEKQLLQEIGYGLHLVVDAQSEMPISPEKYYRFIEGQGVFQVEETHAEAVSGKALLAIEKNDFQDKETLKAAKLVLRRAIQPLLGNKPIKTRELFI